MKGAGKIAHSVKGMSCTHGVLSSSLVTTLKEAGAVVCACSPRVEKAAWSKPSLAN